MTETQSTTGLRLLLIVLGAWLFMRSVNRDQSGRTLIDYMLGQPSKDPYLTQTVTPAAPAAAGGGSGGSSAAVAPAGAGPGVPGAPTSGTYSKAQLEAIWIKNGGNPAQANTAAAIALAESSGSPGSTNHNTNGTTDRGLWQINSIHGSQSTYDPNANAKAAIAISGNGSNWSPWTTFNTGAYRNHL